MAITTQETAKIVADYQRAPNDTGSPEVQVALLSARITYLTEHFKSNKMVQKTISCFKCVDGELIKNGKAASGKQRYLFKS